MKKKYPFTEDEVRAAYQTSVLELAEQYGYKLENQKKVYKVCDMGGLFIWSNGLGWYNHTTEEKGNNVDFLMKFCNAGTKGEAIRLLLAQANITPSAEFSRQNSDEYTQKPKDFKLPEINREGGRQNFGRMIAYLAKTRRVDKEIIYRMIGEKKLYEDIRHNCVFVGYDKSGAAKYASLRGTISPDKLPPGKTAFKGDVSGSEKYPFIIKGKNPHRVFVFEAPIEAMSHATLTKLSGKDYTDDTRISVGGISGSKALLYYLSCCPQTSEVIICFNNDYDKINSITGEIENRGQIATVRLARQLRELGYTDIKKSLPQMPYTDWNEQLCGYYRQLEAASQVSEDSFQEPPDMEV